MHICNFSNSVNLCSPIHDDKVFFVAIYHVTEQLTHAECGRQLLLRLPMIIFWYLCTFSFTCMWAELSNLL